VKKQDSPKVFVTVPTWKESANIKALIGEIRSGYPDLHILVIDDDSPDRTWEIVEKLSMNDDHVHLLHRKGPRGRGTAGRDGFLMAMEMGADYVIEMDADFSHDPVYIRQFLEHLNPNTVLIGSRLIKGGKEEGRSPLRTVITLLSNCYIRLILGLKVRDCTSGYRLFPSEILRKIPLGTLSCKGPEIVQELLYHAAEAGANFMEIPIIFRDRRAGVSSFNWKIMLRSLWFILALRFGFSRKDRSA